MAARGKTRSVVHILTVKIAAIADRRLKRKIVATTKVEITPSPGTIPIKIPVAAPAAILWGESSIRKNFFIRLSIFRKFFFIT